MTSIKSNLSYKTKPLSVCFDLDGTLVDTAPDLIRVLNIVINDVGLSDTDYKTARKEIGFGSRALIKNAFKRQNSYLSETLCDELQQKFLKLYASDIAQKSTPFDGVIEVLTGLKRRSVVVNYGYSTIPFYQLGGDIILSRFRQLPSPSSVLRLHAYNNHFSCEKSFPN